MKKNGVRYITTTAMMTAVSVVIGIFCKSFLNFGAGVFRITFENLPIILSGIIMGPVTGGIVGLSSDMVSYFMSPQTYPPNLVVTLGATVIGILSGIVPRTLVKKKGRTQIIVTGVIAHTVGSLIIKTAGLFQYYQWLVLLRIPLYMIIAPLEIFVICILLRNRSFAKLVGYVETMKKQEAIEYIHSINWTFCKPGLERIGELCHKLGNPQNSLKFIHVAGTNGKGSFCSMLSSILSKEGYRVGLYTSPYILDFNERMQINNEMISDSELAEITEKIKPIADSMEDKPTEFELVTAIAFEYFAKNNCDYVVLECGLGGRLDSTNIISTSVLSVITGIALDHTSILGDTVEKIAYEKAGIIKEGVPVLWCGDDIGAQGVIKEVAKEKNAPLFVADRSTLNVKNATLDGTFFDFDMYQDLEIQLLGEYQLVNGVNVLNAVKILREMGIAIGEKGVKEGLADARWRARFEVMSKDPMVIFDGGHNPQGVDSCVKSIKRYFGEKRVVVLTGVMADKDYGYIAERISTVAASVYCVTPDNPRALDSCEYARVFEKIGTEACGCSTVKEALSLALERAKKENTALICTGSLYMYGEIHTILKSC